MKLQIHDSAPALRRRLAGRKDDKIWFRLGVFALCFLLLSGVRLFSQADTGSITGTVTDASGAVVPGVKVSIVSVATNQRQDITTDSAGRCSSVPLRPGEYRVEPEGTGYKHLLSKYVVLKVQQTAVMDLTMEVGGAQEVVTVTTAPPMVDTTDASQGSVIEEKLVVALAVNARAYLQLALLSEGALPPPNSHNAEGSNSNRAAGFTAGGIRTTDNNYLLDGFDNNIDDTSFDVAQAEVVKPSVDAIQEFKVQTTSYPAQFGRSAGAAEAVRDARDDHAGQPAGAGHRPAAERQGDRQFPGDQREPPAGPLPSLVRSEPGAAPSAAASRKGLRAPAAEPETGDGSWRSLRLYVDLQLQPGVSHRVRRVADGIPARRPRAKAGQLTARSNGGVSPGSPAAAPRPPPALRRARP